MALAGLWENWRSAAAEWIRSVPIVTTRPNALCAELHNRMPVVLEPETWPVGLGEEPAHLRQPQALLAPYPSEAMTSGRSARASATSRTMTRSIDEHRHAGIGGQSGFCHPRSPFNQ